MLPGPLGTPCRMTQSSATASLPGGAVGDRGTHELLLAESTETACWRLRHRVREALEQDTRVLLALDRAFAGTVLDGLTVGREVTRIPPAGREARPSNVLAQMLERVEEESRPGRAVLLVHRPPVSDAWPWWEWTRVEAATNRLLPARVVGLCVYERPRLSDDQVGRMLATHPIVDSGRGARANPSYQDPDDVLRHAASDGQVLGLGAPGSELVDPGLRETRSAVRRLARSTDVADDDVAALLFGVTEVLSNAWTHGRRPVTVRVWASPRSLTVAVRDAGSGPSDPLAGLVRLGDRSGPGNGLWLAHAMADVRHHRSADGYTVYVSVGDG